MDPCLAFAIIKVGKLSQCKRENFLALKQKSLYALTINGYLLKIINTPTSPPPGSYSGTKLINSISSGMTSNSGSFSKDFFEFDPRCYKYETPPYLNTTVVIDIQNFQSYGHRVELIGSLGRMEFEASNSNEFKSWNECLEEVFRFKSSTKNVIDNTFIRLEDKVDSNGLFYMLPYGKVVELKKNKNNAYIVVAINENDGKDENENRSIKVESKEKIKSWLQFPRSKSEKNFQKKGESSSPKSSKTSAVSSKEFVGEDYSMTEGWDRSLKSPESKTKGQRKNKCAVEILISGIKKEKGMII
mmetsp:Transcript_2726/g.4076  ORF Transcript_2726/g.4076 Transcript_2726/m.4076 type:complete len:301 (-) Transcript_2726:9-911(-)